MSEFDVGNHCLNEVNERVSCYRFELGGLLEKVQQNMAKLFEKLLEQTLRLTQETNRKFE